MTLTILVKLPFSVTFVTRFIITIPLDSKLLIANVILVVLVLELLIKVKLILAGVKLTFSGSIITTVGAISLSSIFQMPVISL